METGTLNQPFVAAAAIYAGILIGMLYSAFRLLRRALGAGRVFTIAADVLFLCIATAILAFALYYAAHLALRPAHFVGAVLGFGLYFIAIQPIVKKIYRLRVDKPGKSGCNKKKKN